MNIPERLLLLWHRLQTRRKMNRVFGRGEDPFSYRTSSYERARLDAMEAAAVSGAATRVLEVGCAEGDFTERLLKIGAEVTAVDISPVAIARARRRLGGRALFVEADIRQWSPPGGRSYDLIVLADVLYYLDKPLVRARFEEFFAAVCAWLAPGGRLLLAHAFATEAELAHRRGFRERFEKLGLRLDSESVAGESLAGPVACLVSLLRK